MSSHLPAEITDQILHRIYSEYLEMPGLRLTCQQAQRLWGLDALTCSQSLQYFVEAGFLVRTSVDTYARLTDGAASYPQPRMAKGRLRQSAAGRGRAQAS
jgi:hypothetical protein